MEAALVMPIVLAVNVLIMYLMFFRYDRCLMEQDVGKLLVRGIAAQTDNSEERIKYMNSLAASSDDSKYLMWESDPIMIRQESGTVKISEMGSVRFPFSGWQIDGLPDLWDCSVKRENVLSDPVFWVRSYRKIRNERKTDDSVERER